MIAPSDHALQPCWLSELVTTAEVNIQYVHVCTNSYRSWPEFLERELSKTGLKQINNESDEQKK